MNIFISHEAAAVKEAVKLKELLLAVNNQNTIQLTSDWETIESGEFWMSRINDMLENMDKMLVLITRKESFANLWINFEVGFSIGKGIKPQILVFGGIPLSEMKPPINQIHVIGTGDTNRWMKLFESFGYQIDATTEESLSKLFRQNRDGK